MNPIHKILGLIRTVFDTKYCGKYLIRNFEDIYLKHKTLYPEDDPHEHLALTWIAYMREKGEDPNSEEIRFAAYPTTYQFACLPPEVRGKALGNLILYRERPDIFEKYPQFDEEFSKIMNSVNEAQENGTIEELYGKYNPNMAKL